MEIGDVIASIRRRKRIEQKAMAEKLGISVSYLSQIERNSRIPSGKLLTKIADELDIPLSALLFETIDESEIGDDKDRKLFQLAKPIMDKMLSVLLADEMRTEKKNSLVE